MDSEQLRILKQINESLQTMNSNLKSQIGLIQGMNTGLGQSRTNLAAVSTQSTQAQASLGATSAAANQAVTDVAGFQFDVTGVDVFDAAGGVEDLGWTLEFNESGTVLGFSLTGDSLAEGEHLLTVLDFDVADFEGCITFDNGGALADAEGNTLPVATGDCVMFESAMGGCTDDMACNYDMDANTDDGSCTYPEENYDCEGNCVVEEDCTGECGGDAIVDECGVCEGDNTSCLNVVYFGAVTESDAGNSMEIWLSAVTDVAGFQFDVTGVNVNDASGGVEDLGWTVSFNAAGTVIGFSLTGDVLAEGEHLLTVLDFGVADFEGCITFDNDGALADADGNTLPSATGDCVMFDSAMGGCTDDMACNYDANANVDDGSCTYAEDNFDCDGNFIATQVQIVHNSASPTVDVYVNGGLAIENFEYRTATPVLVLPTSFTVGIAPADGEVIAEFPFDLAEGGSYAVVATGLLGDDATPFGLAATATTFGASSSQPRVNATSFQVHSKRISPLFISAEPSAPSAWYCLTFL